MEFKKNVLDRFRLDGKTAVITGAAGNIGYHTALAFAQAGANVAIVDLPQCLERSKQVAEEFAGLYGGKAAAYGCDLVDAKAVAEMFDAIEKELEMTFDEVQGYKFDSRIAGRVRELIAAAKEDGYSLAIVSGYRTMDRSRVLYANKIAEYQAMGYDEATARVEAAKWVAPPGTSEHHSGLAMDIVSGDYYTKYSDLVEEFENEPEAVWLRENCARFGFILRFPKDKVEVTGINYEPWHFRYVGEEHAAAIMEQGLCLEEYLGEDQP